MRYIITHPILSNYGGILQAYALRTALSTVGIQAQNVHYIPRYAHSRPGVAGLRSAWRYWAPLLKIIASPQTSLPQYEQYPFLHASFRRKFMSPWVLDNKRENLSQLTQRDSFIVGSDQVWRALYANSLERLPYFFLDFATPEQRRNSIAYAASFGSDTWEGTPEETAGCTRLLKEFKAVSVREHSGIRICREKLDTEAVQMPDPTLLLNAEDYSTIIRKSRTRRSYSPFNAVYLLDETAEKQGLLAELATQLPQQMQHLTPHCQARKLRDRLPLSIPQWLRYIRDAEFVITDSFHGCVFAIIFNKPFVCLGNESRGTARFDSLLGTFGLQERLLTNPTAERVSECMRTPIDWERVNAIRHGEQQRAFDFLKQNLEKD